MSDNDNKRLFPNRPFVGLFSDLFGMAYHTLIGNLDYTTYQDSVKELYQRFRDRAMGDEQEDHDHLISRRKRKIYPRIAGAAAFAATQYILNEYIQDYGWTDALTWGFIASLPPRYAAMMMSGKALDYIEDEWQATRKINKY